MSEMSPSATGNLGRPKDPDLAERRKSQILAVASKTFGEQGFANTDVARLADQIGIGKGTIYYHFENKKNLFLASVDWMMLGLLDSIDKTVDPEEDPITIIEDAIQAYLIYFDKHPEFIELIIQERAVFKNRRDSTYFKYREMNLKPWQDMYEKLMKEGRVRKIPVNRIIDVISNILYGTIFTNHFSGRKKTLKTQVKDVLDIFFNGILTETEKEARE
jgi:AcrR family transcriptional regulator